MQAAILTFSIVIPTFRRPETLAETLDALSGLDFPATQYEVVVVDDGADSATRTIVETRSGMPHDVSYVSQPNRGAGAARNLGAQRASGDVLLFLDDDIIVEPAHLRQHMDTRRRHGDAVVNGVRSYSPTTLSMLEATPFGRYRVALERRFDESRDGVALDATTRAAAALYSCNLAISGAAFSELGGFDERFLYAGAEDQDLERRARAHGCLLLRDHAIPVLHQDPAVTLRRFCEREEKGCQSVVMLAAKYPDVAESPMLTLNAPRRDGDPPRLALKKAAKRLLSNAAPLMALHGAVNIVERFRLPDRFLWRWYTGIVGLHIYRGMLRARPDRAHARAMSRE